MFSKEMVVVRFSVLHHLEVADLMRKKRLFIIFGFMLFIACSERDHIHSLSMSALLSSPEQYAGKKVLFVGYLGRGNDVYLTEEHSNINDRSSALFLNLTDEERVTVGNSLCRNKHVEVIGRFDLIKIKGLTPRIGMKKLLSIKEQKTKADCIDIDQES